MVRLTHPGKPGSNGGPTSRSRSDLLTPANVLSRLRNVLASSTFLHTVAIVRWDLGRSLVLREVPIRPLSREEIRGLEELGNSSSDWSRVWVADGFYCRAVRQSSFHGDVILGRFTRPVPVAPGVLLPSGIEHSTLANCVVGPDVLIRDVKLLANYVVGEESVLLNCGTLTCASQTSFGNGTVLPLGPEVGGREVPVYAEIDVEVAATVAFSRHLADFLREYQRRGGVLRPGLFPARCHWSPHQHPEHRANREHLLRAERPGRWGDRDHRQHTAERPGPAGPGPHRRLCQSLAAAVGEPGGDHGAARTERPDGEHHAKHRPR